MNMKNKDLLKASARVDAAARIALRATSTLRTCADLLHEMLPDDSMTKTLLYRGIQNVESGLSDIALAAQQSLDSE